MMRLFRESTSAMPETAASPTEVIITVSAMPTVMANSCSRISGMISCLSAEGVKIGRLAAADCSIL